MTPVTGNLQDHVEHRRSFRGLLFAHFMNMGKNLTKGCHWWTIELCREPFVFVMLFKCGPKAGINKGNLCLLKAI